MSQLTADCLDEIFEYLENDGITLYSCLLANRLWCVASVRILWRSIRNYNTLIACLPNESKEILYNNKIIFSTSTSKPPIFNYASFCKSLSIYDVNHNIRKLLKPHVSAQNLDDKKNIVLQEIFKFLMSQVTSLRKLNTDDYSSSTFTLYPGARDCLKDLSELYCCSNICSKFFYQLSQICHNIQSLVIIFINVISNGLAEFISAQQNLKYLCILDSYDCENFTYMITLLEKIPNTLVKLNICGGRYHMPLSFIAKFTTLQELSLSLRYVNSFEDFKKLQYINFPQLQLMEFRDESPRNELLIKFLENNGKNLKEFMVISSNNYLNLAIVRFCPNLRKVFIRIKYNELETLKMILNSCLYLESIKIICGDKYINEKDILEIVMKYSPKIFYEIIM